MDWDGVKAFLSRNRLAIIIGFGVLISLVLIATAPTFKECVHTNRDAYAHYPPKEGAPSFVGIAYWCGGAVIKESAEAITALATLFIGIFTATLWWVTEGTLKLAREEFISSHRPKIRLRHLRLEQFARGEEIAISLRASNIGDSPATLVGINIDFEIDGAVPRNPNNIMMGADDAGLDLGFPSCERIAAGGTAFVSIKLPMVYEQGWYDPANMRSRVKIVGKIVYSDDANIRRETAFYRQCTGDPNRFYMVDWPNKAMQRDWEYED